MYTKPIFQIKQIEKKIIKRIDDVHETYGDDNLTTTEKWIVGYVNNHQDKDIYQKDFETLLDLSKSTVAEKLIKLESLGYIKRVSSTTDQRQKLVKSAEKGLKIHESINETFEVLNRQIIDGFTEEEVNTLLSYFERMNKNLEKEKK